MIWYMKATFVFQNVGIDDVAIFPSQTQIYLKFKWLENSYRP